MKETWYSEGQTHRNLESGARQIDDGSTAATRNMEGIDSGDLSRRMDHPSPVCDLDRTRNGWPPAR
jgi:hypothetical protein